MGDLYAYQTGSPPALNEISPITNQVVRQVSIPSLNVDQLTYDPADGDLFQASANGTLQVVSLASAQVLSTVSPGPHTPLTYAPTYDPGNGDVYVIGGYPGDQSLFAPGPGVSPAPSSPTAPIFIEGMVAGGALGATVVAVVFLLVRHRARIAR